MSSRNFFAELKRRSVYKVAVAYGVVAWLLVQVASIIFPTYEAPAWVMKVFIALVALGFPIALILAWAYEVTPEGLKKTDAAAGTSPRRSSRAWIAAIVVIGLTAAGLLAWERSRAARGVVRTMPAMTTTPMDARQKSIAVLPFDNVSGDPANDYFSDGVTTEVLNAISHLPNLRVAARTSSFAYKGKNESVGDIAQRLGVTNILEGSVQRVENRVRISVQLIDAANGFQMWSERFDRPATDLFAVQDEISRAVAQALELKLTGANRDRAQRSGTESAESHDSYLKALVALERNAAPEAIASIDRAITLDPKFAAAYALKARILSLLAFSSASAEEHERYVQQGEVAAKQAVALDPTLADAYAALGEIARRRNQYDAAVENFQRATELKPGDPSIWQGLALTYSLRDPEKGLALMLKARELGSTSPYLGRQISYVLGALNRLEEARSVIEENLAAHPDFVPSILDLGRYELWARGRPDRALRHFAEAYRKAPSFVDGGVPVTFYLGLVFAVSGHREEAESWLARQAAVEPNSDAVRASELLLAASAGDKGRIAQLAEQSETAARLAMQRGRAMACEAAILMEDFRAAREPCRENMEITMAGGRPDSSAHSARAAIRLAFVLQKLGEEDEARLLLQEAETALTGRPRFSIVNWLLYPPHGIFYSDAELYALQGEKKRSLVALDAALALPEDGLVPVGTLPIPIEESPLLEGLRGLPEFEQFREEVARRRAIAKERVAAVQRELQLPR